MQKDKVMKGLSESQIEEIRKATEDILENVGFKVSHKDILRRCRAAGAKVDETSGNVRILAPLLKELLAQVPSSYNIASSDGNIRQIGGDNQYCHAIVTDPWIIDYKTQKPRRPCLEDVRRHTIIGQKLEYVIGMSRMDFPVTDVEGPASSLRALEEFILHNNKHIFVYVTSFESFNQYLDIGRILLQGKDLKKSNLMSVAVGIVSPLSLPDLNAELLLSTCAHNFSVIPTICPMAGTTSPYTLASTLLLGNAENVFIAALSQIINPGNPFLYTFGPSVSNMHSGHDMYYTIDKVLWKIAGVQLAHSYNIPVVSECGGTMTYRYDQQNGAEGILFMFSAFASKANILSGIGSCYNAIGMSAEMMLIHTAWLEAVKFLTRGINTDIIHLGVENIKNAGPGGNFLTDDLTLKFLRGGEFFANDLFDYSDGFEYGIPLLERAHQKVEEMVKGFKSPLPENVQEDIHRYFHDKHKKMI